MLWIVAGAPGAGKTAAVGALRMVLPGVVVVDMDEFLGPAGELAAADLTVAAEHWPAYGRLCERLVGVVLDSGVDCLLLTPLGPGETRLDGWWAVLDCPDGARRERLARRPMAADDIEHALTDAAQLRTLGLPLLSSTGTVAHTAAAIAAWMHNAAAVTRLTGPGGQGGATMEEVARSASTPDEMRRTRPGQDDASK